MTLSAKSTTPTASPYKISQSCVASLGTSLPSTTLQEHPIITQSACILNSVVESSKIQKSFQTKLLASQLKNGYGLPQIVKSQNLIHVNCQAYNQHQFKFRLKKHNKISTKTVTLTQMTATALRRGIFCQIVRVSVNTSAITK